MTERPASSTSPACSLCTKPAVFHDRATGRHLCRDHFVADVESRVLETIRTRGLIVPGDHVAIGLSGGKDSTALLMILAKILPLLDNVRLSAVTIDEGIGGYREDTVQAADELARRCNLPHITVIFSDLFGKTLDEFLKGREPEACTVCGILRRKALAVAAGEAGATKLATGHNLDDEAQSVLMNVLRGDLPRLVRDSAAIRRAGSSPGSSP